MSNSKYPQANYLEFKTSAIYLQKFHVSIPIQFIFDNVELNAREIENWLNLNKKGQKTGVLFFPGNFGHKFAPTSARVSIKYTGTSSTDSILATLKFHIFAKEIGDSSELHAYDRSAWSKEVFDAWIFTYTIVAPLFEQELCSHGEELPDNVCKLFRQIMHTHYDDFVLIFGKVWKKLNLQEDIESLMRKMLIEMTSRYMLISETGAALPVVFDMCCKVPGLRICAGCLTYKRGAKQMRRCVCGQVYYCSSKCQKENWDVHSTVCGAKGAEKAQATSALTLTESKLQTQAYYHAHRDDPTWLPTFVAGIDTMAAYSDALLAEMEATLASFLATSEAAERLG
jgi:hypothetical protein